MGESGSFQRGFQVIIDVHAHAYPVEEVDTLRQRTLALDGLLPEDDPNKWQLSHDPTIEGLLMAERQAGVDRFALLPVSGSPQKVDHLNNWVIQEAKRHPEIIPFGTMLPDDRVFERVSELKKRGILGIKLHPFLQRIDVLSLGAMRLFEALEAQGLLLVLDTMDLEGLLRYKPHLREVVGQYQGFGMTSQKISELASRFPNLIIVASHMGCLYNWEDLGPLYDLKNVFFDTSFVSGILDETQAVKIMERKGFDRILFGTDAPWRPPQEVVRWVGSLSIPGKAKEMIFSENFLRLLKKEKE